MATALHLRSLADFLAWERQQPERYERVGGVVRMITGGTIDHNRIIRNVAEALARGLQGGDCEVFISDVKVVSPAGDVMYPDVVVACGPIAGKATELNAPTVVVEVLSQSTAERDQGRKRWGLLVNPFTAALPADRSGSAHRRDFVAGPRRQLAQRDPSRARRPCAAGLF